MTGGTTQTVGQYITSNAAELKKFLNSAVVATVGVALQEAGEFGFASTRELTRVLEVVVRAQVPAELQAEIMGRLVDLAQYRQLVTADLQYGQWTYDPSRDEFFRIAGTGEAGIPAGSRVVARGTEAQFLAARQDARLALEAAGLDYADDIESLLQDAAPRPYYFPAGTPIATPAGAVPVEDVRPGDHVLAFDPSVDGGRGALVPARVVRLFDNETEEWLRLSWEGGDLTVTPGHRFLDADGTFRRIDAILEGGCPRIVLADGAAVDVTAERIVWSEQTRHLFEEVEAVAMAAGDGLAHHGRGA